MLDDFKIKQNIVYNLIKKSLNKNKLSHAYLIETNNYSYKDNLILAIVKSILCPYNYTNNSKCVNCTQCENIDKNIFGEVKIINPDGLWIKKEQIINLQKEFQTKSLLASKKIYIINEGEKLNISAANTLLKFLEEPSENIIAILVTDNIHHLLDTIVSRCQIISLSREKEQMSLEKCLSVQVDDIEIFRNSIIKFISSIEKKQEQAILTTKKLFSNVFQEKNDLICAFELMIFYYKDLVNKKINRKCEYFDDEDMKDIIEINSLEQLNKKIKIIMELKNKIYINANTGLLIDKLILDLGGNYEYCRNSI